MKTCVSLKDGKNGKVCHQKYCHAEKIVTDTLL